MRSDLRLEDLGREPAPSKLMNVKIPAHVSEAIDRVARDLGCSKTAAVIALLNEGLDAARAAVPASAAPGKLVPRARGRGAPRVGRPRKRSTV